ncbi:MAG: RluA family pseudouridine synthase [Proteobacteria bacterium]|nr:RluA family pseudouridine synthase [Pseudomonadota bacterium]
MTSAEILTLTVTETEKGARLDKVLATLLPAISRSRLKELTLAGAVAIDGAAAADPSRKMRAGETITLAIPAAVAPDPVGEDLPLEIVHEDADLIVVNKPAGLVVHPSAGHETGTLVNALIHHCGASLSGINGVMRPGIVHRLDKDTSGLLVVAKNDAAHKALADQFADHGRTGPLERLYRAICWGVPRHPQGSIDAAIARSTINREKMAVVAEDKGRFAITHYRVLDVLNGADGKPVASLIECALETGRTHQIRVHMAHIGHPLLGDETYGAGFRTKMNLLTPAARAALEAMGRQALHAGSLGFEHGRTGEFLSFESPLPQDFQALLDAFPGTRRAEQR